MTTKLAWGYVAIVFTIGLGWMLVTPPGVFSDSVSGFLTMRSMERGAPFNHTFLVNEDDIARDDSQFTAWWTPGQYVVPMIVDLATGGGLDLGENLIATTLMTWAVGLFGFFRLFRRLGFSSEVAALSIAVLVSQSYVLGWGRFYHGGEQLQWCFFPWFVLLAVRWRSLRLHQVLGLAAALTFGIFLKSAFAIVGSAVVASVLWHELSGREKPLSVQALSLCSRASAAVGLALAALWAYTRLGTSPAGRTSWSVSSIDLSETMFAVAAPVSTLFDLWTRYMPNHESDELLTTNFDALFLIAFVSVVLLWAIVRFSGAQRIYLSLVVGVYACLVASFSLAFALDLLISFHVRHFRLGGVLFVPGAIAMLFRIPFRVVRLALLGAMAAMCVILVIHFCYPRDGDPMARPVGAAGFSHIYASQGALDALARIDERLGFGNNLIAVPWPQLALDVENSRVFDLRTALLGAEYFRHKIFFGHVDNLVLVLPAYDDESGATPMMTRTFRQHDDWRRIHAEVDDFVFMYSGNDDDIR